MQSALAEAQAAETRARADRDALHSQLTQAHRERDQAVATAKSMAKDLKRLAHRVTELAAVGEQSDAENAKLNEEVGELQAERDRMQALVDTTKESAAKEMNRLRDEVARVREEHVQDRMAWMQEAKDREKVLALAEARVQMQAEELARIREHHNGFPQQLQQLYQQADRDVGHGDHAAVIEELESENAELADVIRAMREEMERVAAAHRRELDELTERARVAESKGQEAQQRVEERERAMVEKNHELERLAEKVRLATASAPTPQLFPQLLPAAAPSVPTWNPQLGQWVLVPAPVQPSTAHLQQSLNHPSHHPPAPPAPNPPLPTTLSADHGQAMDSLRAEYQTQLDHHRSQLLEALSDRERLISESNRLHAELRRVRSQLARVPQPPLLADTQVQTDPILIASMGHMPPAFSEAAVLANAAKGKRRGVGSLVAGAVNATSDAGATKGIGGLTVGNGSQHLKAQSQSQGTRGKSGTLEESKRDALLRLRKMGLRNWNDTRDDE
ncbi:hypothetical protein BCR44DRAFT_1220604 [Catenaria anguillulae PL171]|uniref:Uncharacterized protein n=1 Tax=Catenaria anguillulae PL171 TaxID=765915 RepID=A0A1Y2I3R9_9FUNG|nr:hypothetical protein BCR44DRAFT_1220604 [Catenaria anguillulae PL171]